MYQGFALYTLRTTVVTPITPHTQLQGKKKTQTVSLNVSSCWNTSNQAFALPDCWRTKEPLSFQNAWAAPASSALWSVQALSSEQTPAAPLHTMSDKGWCPSVVSNNCNLWLSIYQQCHHSLTMRLQQWHHHCFSVATNQRLFSLSRV